MSSNGFLSANQLSPTSAPSNRRRSVSITPSQRSSRSRITLVEHDPDLAQDFAEKSNTVNKIVTYQAPKYTWRDHLLGVLCFNVSKRKEVIIKEDFEEPKLVHEPEMDLSSSPWILPVYVLSTRRDTDKNQVPKEAKCTIDTGNMQGNIVSRAFVENVLEFSEANFSDLTLEEKEGGTGITGHKLMPDGAIYLTWYHKKSTRVFRNMRFLVSPNQHCDLIIGARSIEKDKLLAVPNLMADGASGIDEKRGKLIFKFNKDHEDKKRTQLYNAWFEAKQAWVKIDDPLKDARKKGYTREIAAREKEITEPEEKLLIAVLELQIYDWGHGRDSKKPEISVSDRNKMIDENIKDLEAIKTYDLKDSLLQKAIGSEWKIVKKG